MGAVLLARARAMGMDQGKENKVHQLHSSARFITSALTEDFKGLQARHMYFHLVLHQFPQSFLIAAGTQWRCPFPFAPMWRQTPSSLDGPERRKLLDMPTKGAQKVFDGYRRVNSGLGRHRPLLRSFFVAAPPQLTVRSVLLLLVMNLPPSSCLRFKRRAALLAWSPAKRPC